MIARLAWGSCRPSATAALQPPAYHAQDTPFADSVSPTVLSVCGGTGDFAGSARSSAAPAAGAMPEGWYQGCEVLTAYPSGVTWPSKICIGPSSTDAGDAGRRLTRPFSSSCARIDAGASRNSGVHAQTSQKWLRNEPPYAAWKKRSASVYSRAHCHSFIDEPS